MKKMRKLVAKVLCLALVLGTTVASFATSYNLSWRTLPSEYEKQYTFKGADHVSKAPMYKFVMDGNDAFCLESGRGVENFNDKVDSDVISIDYVKEASQADSLQSKIAYLGYHNSQKTDKDFAFTQMYLWQSLPNAQLSGNDNVKFVNAGLNGTYEKWKSSITSKINSWETKPSFNNVNQELKVGESGEFVDDNRVLEDYNTFTYSQNGVEVSHTKGSNVLSYAVAEDIKVESVVMTEETLGKAGGRKYDSTVSGNFVYSSSKSQKVGAYGKVNSVGLALDFTVVYPNIATTAIDKETQNHISNADDSVEIIDTVTYENLVAGDEYEVTGTLVNKITGDALMIDGAEVKSSVAFIPEKENGEIEVLFNFNGTSLAGMSSVVFESLTKNGIEITKHEDLGSEEQTIIFPALMTMALDTETNSHTAVADNSVKVIDKVSYSNLVPGLEYAVTGTLMDNKTGEPIVAGGKVITSRVEFTPTEENGYVNVPFEFDGTTIRQEETVIYEKLEQNSNTVALHEDINNKDQTIKLEPVKQVPKTGDETDFMGFIVLAGAALFVWMLMFVKKRY